jgi:hypothetical protein
MRFFSPPKHLHQLWDHSVLIQWVLGFTAGGTASLSITEFKRSGAIPLIHFMSSSWTTNIYTKFPYDLAKLVSNKKCFL